MIPGEPLLSLKGIAVALADGISSSQVSRVASEVGGQGLPDRLLLHVGILVGEDLGAARASTRPIPGCTSQTRRSQYAYDTDTGYVCTLSAMVIKSTTAHLFHVGDARIYRVAGNSLEQLTDDHRVVDFVGAELSRPRARRQSAGRDRLPGAARSRRATSSCWRPTASTSMLDAAHRRRPIARPRRRSRRGRHGDRREGARARQHGQSHRADRPRRRTARRRGERGVRPAGRAAAAAAARAAHGVRRLPDRPRTARQQPQPHLSRGRRCRDEDARGRSRSRRSTCATIPPISSGS